MRLGIDFGTTRTVVSVSADGRYPVVRFDFGDRVVDHLPGFAAATASGLRFGDEAARIIGTTEATWATASVKRLISKSAPDDPIEGLPGVTAVELAVAYLSWVRMMLSRCSTIGDAGGCTLGDAPLNAMVAVPAHAGARQRFVTLEGFRRAGFFVEGLLSEPTAAAIEYARGNVTAISARSPKEFVVVYDMGGGTFDTAALSLRGRRYALLASEGISRLGGADFDAMILRRALARAALPSWDSFGLGDRVALLECARLAKESLRTKSQKLLVDLSSVRDTLPSVVLDVDDLYAASLPLLEPSFVMVERLMARLSEQGLDTNDPRKLGAIYLVGGSVAYVPLLRALRGRFGRKIVLAHEPHAATAIGLAVAADPRDGVFVREAMTRFFGVWREGDAGRDKIFDPILSKDTLPPEGGPLVVQRRYRPAHRVGHLRFLECSALTEQGQPAGDLTPWNEIRFPYDPALAETSELSGVDGGCRRVDLDEEIVETYTHAPDGTIAVAIENRTRGYRRDYDLGALR